MPSTRIQKAKARYSREMDMMSDFEIIVVLNGNEKTNPIEREVSDANGNTENHCDIESNSQIRVNHPLENDFGQYGHGGRIPKQDRFQETMETFTIDFNKRCSQEMDSLMSMMHSHINRATSSTIAERVLPEIQNIVRSMSYSRNRDTESGLFPDSQRIREDTNGFKSKITKTGLQVCC